MAKLFSVLFFGLLFALIPTAILLAGVMESYLKYHGIHEYFNPYFAHTLNGWGYLLSSLVVGYLLLYAPLSNLFRGAYLAMIFFALLAFFPSVGRSIGEILFYQKGVSLTLKNGEKREVEILYEGREAIYYRLPGDTRTSRLEKTLP